MTKDRTLAAVATVVAVAVGLLLIIVALGVLLGVGSASAQDDPPEVARAAIRIVFQESDESVLRIIDELEPETLVTVDAEGFGHDVTGRIFQCFESTVRRCGNQLSVRFDDRGHAAFQYLVTDGIGGLQAPGACGLADERCWIELTDGERTAVVETVFADEAPPPGRVTVSPRDGLAIGDSVTVTLSKFPPASTMTATICAMPATLGPRCGAPAPEVLMTVGDDGTASAEMTLDVGEVGEDRVACGRRTPCRVVVLTDETGVRALPVMLSFADAPGADYEIGRITLGVAAATGFALLGLWLFRSTDWQPPPEADSSAIDDAEFADLDLEAELFSDAPPVTTA